MKGAKADLGAKIPEGNCIHENLSVVLVWSTQAGESSLEASDKIRLYTLDSSAVLGSGYLN